MILGAQAIYAANALVPLPEVLTELGVYYRDVPSQLPCPIHKFGLEERPSAHLYLDNYIYCFTCARQYGCVDVWSARRGIDEEGAALALLERWKIPEEQARKVSRNITLPPKKTLPEGLRENLESSLLEFRGRSSLGLYRDWIQRIYQFSNDLIALDDRDQKHRLEFFRAMMRQELSANAAP